MVGSKFYLKSFTVMHRSFHSQKEHVNGERFFAFCLKSVSKEDILIKGKKCIFTLILVELSYENNGK
jgi:hypothetical protein